MSGWEYALLVILVILVITILTWVIWYFGFSFKGQGVDGPCNINSDCISNLYCGGDYRCHTGGGTQEGGACSNNSQCLVGLVCNNAVCTPSFNPARTKIASFSDTYIIITIDNVPYYLTITDTNSFFSKTQPTETFTYNEGLQRLTYGNKEVGINAAGNLTTANSNKIIFYITNTNIIVLSDEYSNDLLQSVAPIINTNNFLAFFFNLLYYPNAQDITRVTAELSILSS